jgi:hypothetical protein
MSRGFAAPFLGRRLRPPLWGKIMRVLMFVLMGVGTACHAANPWDLCIADEKLVFGCVLGEKVASICASANLSSASGYVQYRYGTIKKIELVYPKEKTHPKGHFFFSSTIYGGGDEFRVRFNNEGHDYFAFHKMVRTNFKSGETNDPDESAGIHTRFKNKFDPARRCDNFVSFSDEVKYFEHEQFE